MPLAPQPLHAERHFKHHAKPHPAFLSPPPHLREILLRRQPLEMHRVEMSFLLFEKQFHYVKRIEFSSSSTNGLCGCGGAAVERTECSPPIIEYVRLKSHTWSRAGQTDDEVWELSLYPDAPVDRGGSGGGQQGGVVPSGKMSWQEQNRGGAPFMDLSQKKEWQMLLNLQGYALVDMSGGGGYFSQA